MKHSDFQRAVSIFHEAIARPTAERSRFLELACEGDAALFQRVSKLLGHDDHETQLIGGVEDGVMRTTGSDCLEGPGSRIGPYKLLQQIGEGGFGIVYMAEQQEPVVRRVALKIIKAGMDTKQVIGRFESERQALAMMDHPNIARVLDAGATETGRPYFVMELVKGIPVTDYCDQHNVSARERIELLTQVCFAVQHAHQKGIIHRDLKPNNVLVTIADGRAIPKVIDFGIAKAMNQRLTDKTVFTEFRQLIGTPEYMSPEQAEVTGVDVDTRSDIYALGVLLYVLLTGTTPFDPGRLRSAAIGEIQRIIREEDPQKPSTRLQTLLTEQSRRSPSGDQQSTELDGLTIADIAKRRSTDPSTLRKMLRGDLDWIVMKAMDKDRTRRYETAHMFAMDLNRYLREEPVIASPPTWRYVAHKFIRRHRAMVGSIAAVFVVLILGLLGTTWALMRANDAGVQTMAVNAFLRDVLTSAKPDRAGADVAVIDVLRNAESTITGRFANHPAQEAMVRDLIGEVYLAQGKVRESSSQFRTAFDLFQEEYGSTNHHTLRTGSRLLFTMAQLGSNETPAFGADMLTRLERTNGPLHESTLDARSMLASMKLYRGRYDEAEPELRSVLSAASRSLGETHRVTVDVTLLLARLLRAQSALSTGDRTPFLTEASELLKRAIDAQESHIGNDRLFVFGLMQQRAGVLHELGRFEEGIALSHHVLGETQGMFGEDHWVRSGARHQLALTLHALGRVDEAAEYASVVLEQLLRVRGALDPMTLGTVNDMLPIFMAAGKSLEGEQATQLLRDYLASSPNAHFAPMVRYDAVLSRFIVRQGRIEEARTLLQSHLTAESEIAHPDERALIHLAVGELCLAESAYEQAERHLLVAWSAYDEKLGPSQQLDPIDICRGLVKVYEAIEQPAEAGVWRTRMFDMGDAE